MTFDPPRSISQLRAWLDHYRDWRLRLAEFDGYASSTGPNPAGITSVGSHSDKVEHEIMRRDLLWQRVRAIDSGLARLGTAYRLFIWHRYVQQASIALICRETRLARSQVYAILREAVVELFSAMGGDSQNEVAAGLDKGVSLDGESPAQG